MQSDGDGHVISEHSFRTEAGLNKRTRAGAHTEEKNGQSRGRMLRIGRGLVYNMLYIYNMLRISSQFPISSFPV